MCGFLAPASGDEKYSDRRRCSRSIPMKTPLFRLRFDAPQLKAMRADRLFDRIAGKVKGRSSSGSDHANLSPRSKLFREIAPRCVSGERPQTGACIGLEDKESHRITLL